MKQEDIENLRHSIINEFPIYKIDDDYILGLNKEETITRFMKSLPLNKNYFYAGVYCLVCLDNVEENMFKSHIREHDYGEIELSLKRIFRANYLIEEIKLHKLQQNKKWNELKRDPDFKYFKIQFRGERYFKAKDIDSMLDIVISRKHLMERLNLNDIHRVLICGSKLCKIDQVCNKCIEDKNCFICDVPIKKFNEKVFKKTKDFFEVVFKSTFIKHIQDHIDKGDKIEKYILREYIKRCYKIEEV